MLLSWDTGTELRDLQQIFPQTEVDFWFGQSHQHTARKDSALSALTRIRSQGYLL